MTLNSQSTVNPEIFVHENIHVSNVCVNKFLWVSHKNILTRKFCQVEITVHVLLIKQLLYFFYLLPTVLQRQINAVRLLLQQNSLA